MNGSPALATEPRNVPAEVAVGRVVGLFRYPVKSMAGEPLERVELAMHGIPHDRRFAFRRMQAKGPFPWLTATRLPSLILYRPLRKPDSTEVTHVLTPDGRELPLWSDELRDELAARHGSPVEMAESGQGIFDDAVVSLITTGTLRELERASGVGLDVRRFRPNLLVRTEREEPFEEQAWIGRTLRIGTEDDAPVIRIDASDVRCAMIGLDPDTGAASPQVLKAAVRINDNHAGVYAFVVRTGLLSMDAPLVLLGSD
jgi:uncharacterized protein YcbX